MIKNIIIAVLVLGIFGGFYQYNQTQNNWKQLKTIDDQKITADTQALTACVDGWTATTDLNIPALTKATDDMNAARKSNTSLLQQRTTQLKKLGY